MFESKGGKIHLEFEASKIGLNSDLESGSQFPIRIEGGTGAEQIINASYILTCAGLQSDRVAELSGTRVAV